jgi:hypothetical protein
MGRRKLLERHKMLGMHRLVVSHTLIERYKLLGIHLVQRNIRETMML